MVLGYWNHGSLLSEPWFLVIGTMVLGYWNHGSEPWLLVIRVITGLRILGTLQLSLLERSSEDTR